MGCGVFDTVIRYNIINNDSNNITIAVISMSFLIWSRQNMLTERGVVIRYNIVNNINSNNDRSNNYCIFWYGQNKTFLPSGNRTPRFSCLAFPASYPARPNCWSKFSVLNFSSEKDLFIMIFFFCSAKALPVHRYAVYRHRNENLWHDRKRLPRRHRCEPLLCHLAVRQRCSRTVTIVRQRSE